MMAIRTQKFNVFVSEPMGDKDITKVDGINDDLGMKLAAKGFNKVISLLPYQAPFFFSIFFFILSEYHGIISLKRCCL